MERGLQKFENNSFGINVIPKKPDFLKSYKLPGMSRASGLEIDNHLVKNTIGFLQKLDSKEDVFSPERGIFPVEMDKCVESACEELKQISVNLFARQDEDLNKPSFEQKSKNIVAALISNILTMYPDDRFKGLRKKIGESKSFEEVLNAIRKYVSVWQRIDSFDKK